MVFRTLIMRAAKQSFGDRIGLPGISVNSIKHDLSVLPLHFFTVGGIIVCSWFVGILMNSGDYSVSQRPELDVEANGKLAIFNAGEIDWEKFSRPETRPAIYKGQE